MPALSPLWTFEGTSTPGVNNLLVRIGREVGGWTPEGPSEAVKENLQALAYRYPDPNVQRAATALQHSVAADNADAALPDASSTVSSADVAETTYLLDLWGSWCGPRIDELPALHALYERYQARGVEIVSVATFDTPEDVAALRERGHPMPWRHALLPDDQMEVARDAFEFTGIPAALLVAPDGTILAEGQGARGDALEAALAAHFGSE